MHLILLVVGVAAAVAGLAMIRTGVPVEDVAGAALFISGTVAVVGGLIVVAVAAAVHKLARMAERLEIQPLPLPPVAAVGREDPAPRPARAAPTPPAAPAQRPSLLGWFGRGSAPPPPAGTASVPRAAPAAEPTPAVDLAPLAKIPAEPPAAPAPVMPPPVRPVAPPRPAVKPAAATNGAPETTVYKSGVIDGMAYTLFMDGSIEAELPQGRVKFASVDELQKYLTARSEA
jgi:hypothetical protein